MNNLESTSHTLATMTENVSSALSNLADADIAKESAIMARRSVVQQAGAAVLAQANQEPMLVMQLLG